MKEIKIKYCGVGFDPDSEYNFVEKILEGKFKIIRSDDPDYIICGPFSDEHLNYPNAVKIYWTGEDDDPDFSLYDYIIGHNDFSYPERYLFFPYCCVYALYKPYTPLSKLELQKILDNKTVFCDFIYHHERKDGLRKKFFNMLSQYKQVNSYGIYLNNYKTETFNLFNKAQFQDKSKFSICFESCNHSSFITEKIYTAFLSHSIPIYLGSKNVDKYFNKDSFINANDYSSIEEVIEVIKMVDQDETKYLKMLSAHPFVDDFINIKRKELESFLLNIFSINFEDASKRSSFATPVKMKEIKLKLGNKLIKFRKKYPFFSKILLLFLKKY